MSEPDVVIALSKLGFSLNESRAYHALLLDSPATGYEVGARAQIPRSAVYGVLRRLVQAGVARSMGHRPERFVPVEVEHVIELLRRRFDSSSKAFEQAVKSLDTSPVVPDAFSVRGYERVIEEASQMVNKSTQLIVLSGWPAELDLLKESLQQAHERGVFIVIFSHAKLEGFPGHVFSYGLDEHDLESFWKHRIVLVVDDTNTLVASAEGAERDHAVISGTIPLAELATNQVVLDINLLARRNGIDIRAVMERMLGERVGSLDSLLSTVPRDSSTQEPPTSS